MSKDELKAVEASISGSNLLDAPKENPGVWQDLARSFAYTAIQSPAEGVAQLIDRDKDGSCTKFVRRVGIEAPIPADLSNGKSNWIAQHIGAGLGVILPVMAIHKGVSGAMSSNYSLKAGLAMSEHTAALTGSQALAACSLKTGEGALTGLIYGGVFTPAQPGDDSFKSGRWRNAVSSALTFGTLNASALGLRALGERTASSIPLLSRALSNDAVLAGGSGAFAGFAAANSESALSGKGWASAEDQIGSMAQFALTGAGLTVAMKGIADMAKPQLRESTAPESFRTAGVDVDGRALADSKRASVIQNLPDYSTADMARARTQTIKDLAEIKALEEGRSVLDQFKQSDLSIAQKYRVLNSLAEVREHFVNHRVNGVLDLEQRGNWIHTQGELGRVIDASKASKLNPVQTEDALLSSMFADSVKNKTNFFTHHMEGALAADHVLRKEFGAGFNRTRLDGITNSVLEHQIGPPEFMSNFYETRIRGALNNNLSAEQELAMTSLKKKMADPLNPENTAIRTDEGRSVLALSEAERDLLRLAGPREWYVPNATNPWYKQSRAVIDGDTLDNYFTPGGVGKITALGGPETAKAFITARIDTDLPEVTRSTNVGCARASGQDAKSLLTTESLPLAESGLAQTEVSISQAKSRVADWLKNEKGLEPENVPFFGKKNKLKYPQFGKHESEWWSIHRLPENARSAEQQQFYDKHRFAGLTEKQKSNFLLAKEIRERMADELRAAQRLDGQQPPQYTPATLNRR